MLIASMSYEEIYREIKEDARELYDVVIEDGKRFQHLAKRAKKYPFGKAYIWKHPKSRNEYMYFFGVKRHSDWDKPPRLVVFTEYDDEGGKTTITVAKQVTGKIGISIFRPHFFKRYFERNLSRLTDFTPETEHDVKLAFLIRTSSAIPLGSKVVSPKELEKDEPEFSNDSLLTPEGLILCKRLRANTNIVLFKTYLSIQDLFAEQYAEVTMNLIHAVCLRAISDSPRFQKSIEKIYLEGIAELNKLWLDSSLPFEQKQELRIKKYGEVIDEFYKYIV